MHFLLFLVALGWFINNFSNPFPSDILVGIKIYASKTFIRCDILIINLMLALQQAKKISLATFWFCHLAVTGFVIPP